MQDQRKKLDEQSDYLKKQEENLKEHQKTLDGLFNEVKSLKLSLAKNVEEINSNVQKIQYSEIVKNNKPEKEVIVITPNPDLIQNQSVNVRCIKDKIDPISVPVSNIRTTKKGNVIIDCEDISRTNATIADIKSRLGNDFEVRQAKKHNPKLKLVGLKEDLNPEQILKYMLDQNDYLNINDYIKILSIRYIRFYNDFAVKMEVDKVTYDKIMEKGIINISWCRCKPKEDFNIMRCFNCSGYNHKSNSCKNKRACPKCAGDHNYKDCRSVDEECINCRIVNEKFGLKHNLSHACWSQDCPVLKRKTDAAVKRARGNIA